MFGQGPGYYDRHYIPRDIDLRDVRRFLDFCAERHQLLAHRLSIVLGFEEDLHGATNKGAERNSSGDFFDVFDYLVDSEHVNFFIPGPTLRRRHSFISFKP